METKQAYNDSTDFEKIYLNNFESTDVPEVFSAIKTNNTEMVSIFQYIQSIAKSPEPILITGETGVGKELIAKSIHAASGLKGKLVTVNVAGLDDNVFSDTLFGHAKGAFTGAENKRTGLIEKAAGGTLFLDEIGDLRLSSQVKLLRLLQEGEYLPLGMDDIKRSNARIITATNENLWDLQKIGRFRKDLNFRLRTHHIAVPPLRDRKDDIPILLNHFIKEAAGTLQKKPPTVQKKIVPILKAYSFPGNIREMKSMIFDIVSTYDCCTLDCDAFENYFRCKNKKEKRHGMVSSPHYLPVLFGEELPTLKEASKILVKEAMKRSNGKQTDAAKLLGISVQALNKRLKKMSSFST